MIRDARNERRRTLGADNILPKMVPVIPAATKEGQEFSSVRNRGIAPLA